MSYKVSLTNAALRDLEEIDDYLTATDSPQTAKRILGKMEEGILGLRDMPERGSYPRELLQLGIREFREIVLKPYRIVYRVRGKRIYIYLIADGRRDMRTLLSQRLLGE